MLGKTAGRADQDMFLTGSINSFTFADPPEVPLNIPGFEPPGAKFDHKLWTPIIVGGVVFGTLIGGLVVYLARMFM